MTDFIRSLCITICTALFNFIPTLCKLFYDLAANHNLFSSETIDTFSKNIYVLVSVVMLFAFAVKAIESIINPDMLFDSKKGFTSVIKRSVIALVLIIAIPFGFDFFYKFQDEVMGKSLIEKLIIGVSVGENENLSETSGAGQMLASSALASVLHPREDDTCTEYEDSDVCIKYNNAIEDVGKLYKLIPDINEKVTIDGDKEYVLTYEGYGLLSVLVGGVLIYMLTLFCIDTALRLIKLSFLELSAPISVVAYIFGGNDILKKWFKEVKGTAFSLFGRIAALALMIFVLSILPEFIDNNFTGLEGKIVNLLIIMATLMFVKEAPNLIERIFGIKIGGKGGIAGRLESMAGVGNIAKSGWEKVRNVGTAVGGTALVGAGLVAGAIGSPLFAAGAGIIGFGGKKVADGLRNTKVGEGIRIAGSTLKAVSEQSNPYKAIRAGAESLGLGQTKEERDYDRQTQEQNKKKSKIEADIKSGSLQTSGIYDASGNFVSGMESSATPAAFDSMLRELKTLNATQAKALKDYQSAENNSMRSKKDSNTAQQIRNILQNARDTESSGIEKAKINEIITNFEMGRYNSATLSAALSAVGGTALTSSIKGTINTLASDITNSAVGIKSLDVLTSEAENANTVLSLKGNALDAVIEKSSADTAMIMKQAKSVGKDMNKKNTGTI